MRANQQEQDHLAATGKTVPVGMPREKFNAPAVVLTGAAPMNVTYGVMLTLLNTILKVTHDNFEKISRKWRFNNGWSLTWWDVIIWVLSVRLEWN